MQNVYDIKHHEKLNFVLDNHQLASSVTNSINGNVLIGIHLYYNEDVEYYFSYIRNIPINIDIVFCVSTEETAQKVRDCAEHFKLSNYEIIQKPNRGRDISSLLIAIGKKILDYDFFAFVHDKRENYPFQKDSIEQWRDNLWINVIGSEGYIYNIIDLLQTRDDIGLLVPPPPTSLSDRTEAGISNGWMAKNDIVYQLIERLKIECDIDFMKPMFTYGTVFWCKTNALKKLIQYPWKYEDFEDEPLALYGTISHAIERILAYVAQDAGYKTGYVMNSKYASAYIEIVETIKFKSFELMREQLGIWCVDDLFHYEERCAAFASFCKKHSHIYIYGAGNVGRCCYSLLSHIGFQPEAFLVTKRSENVKSLFGLSVIEIEELEYTDETGIIVGVGINKLREVLEQINQKGFHNVINWFLEKIL